MANFDYFKANSLLIFFINIFPTGIIQRNIENISIHSQNGFDGGKFNKNVIATMGGPKIINIPIGLGILVG